jgi:hypothetical protein
MVWVQRFDGAGDSSAIGVNGEPKAPERDLRDLGDGAPSFYFI